MASGIKLGNNRRQAMLALGNLYNCGVRAPCVSTIGNVK